MESRAKFLGHAAHQQLIVFPVGLLGMSVLFDVIHIVFDKPNLASAAHYMIAAGILSALVAALFGLIDWLGIPRDTRAWRIGLTHLIVNDTALVLFALSWIVRRDDVRDPPALAVLLSVIAAGILSVGGWLGGELVARLGVAVDPGANLNAPSSLKGGPADRPSHPVRQR